MQKRCESCWILSPTTVPTSMPVSRQPWQAILHLPEQVLDRQRFGISLDLCLRQVFVERGADDVSDVEVPALAEDDDGRRIGRQQGFHILIVLDPDAAPARAAEGGQLRAAQLDAFRTVEELEILRIRAGIARLDVGHAELVECLEDLDLVLHGKGNAFKAAHQLF